MDLITMFFLEFACLIVDWGLGKIIKKWKKYVQKLLLYIFLKLILLAHFGLRFLCREFCNVICLHQENRENYERLSGAKRMRNWCLLLDLKAKYHE